MESGDIRIVLVAPSHPGNIGAAARAMKNMSLDALVLVSPKQFPHPEATARASIAFEAAHSASSTGLSWKSSSPTISNPCHVAAAPERTVGRKDSSREERHRC